MRAIVIRRCFYRDVKLVLVGNMNSRASVSSVELKKLKVKISTLHLSQFFLNSSRNCHMFFQRLTCCPFSSSSSPHTVTELQCTFFG